MIKKMCRKGKIRIMNKEELKLYVKKSCENILKQLAENPKEMFDLLELQDKYNNLLKEKIELKRQIKKQKEVIDKAIELLGNYKHYSTPDEKQNGDNEDLVNNVFDILKEVE